MAVAEAVRLERGLCREVLLSMSQKHRADPDPEGGGEFPEGGRRGARLRGSCPQLALVPLIGQPHPEASWQGRLRSIIAPCVNRRDRVL